MFNPKEEKSCSVFQEWQEIARKQEEILDNLHLLLKRFAEDEEKATSNEELISLNNAGYEVDTQGIPYNAFIVSKADAGKIINVDYKGVVRYEIELVEGVNQVNLLNGSNIISQNGITVGFVKTQNPIKL
jgi:hypothetical protein